MVVKLQDLLVEVEIEDNIYIYIYLLNIRGVVQLGECMVWDHEVVGSSPATPTFYGNNYKMKKEIKEINVTTFQCPKCHDWIYSLYNHDFRKCSCESIYVDGDTTELNVSGHFRVGAGYDINLPLESKVEKKKIIISKMEDSDIIKVISEYFLYKYEEMEK